MRRRLLIIALVALITTALLPAQEQTDELVWKNMLGQAAPLYPELLISRNPSVLLGLTRPLLFPGLGVSAAGNSATETIPAGQPQEGGTLEETTRSLALLPLGAEYYQPLANGMVAGGWLFGGLANFNRFRETDTNFSVADQTITTAVDDKLYVLSLGGNYAMQLGPVIGGVEAFVDLEIDPVKEEFTTVNDPTAADTTYYADGDGTTFYETRDTRFGGALGVTHRQDALELGAGLRFTRRVVDASTGWTAADVNGNGDAEEIVAAETYETNAVYGNGEAAYDYLDRSTFQTLALYPHAIYRMSDSVTLVGSGYWSLLNTSGAEFYERVVENSLEIETETFTSSLTDFGLTAGVELAPLAGLTVRAGLGYAFRLIRRDQTDLDAAGGSNFEIANTNRYNERNWGVDPRDGQVIQQAGNPTTETSHNISLLAGSKWRPVAGVEFFSTARLGMGTAAAVYHVFDRVTGTVWSETERTGTLDWNLTAVAGMMVDVSDNLRLGMTTSGIASSATRAASTDALPVSDAGNTTTVFAGPEPYLDDSSTGAFTVNVFFVIGL